MVPAMDVPIAHPVSNIACIPFVAFVFKLLVSIIVFSFLGFINKYFIIAKINTSSTIGIKTPQAATPGPRKGVILNF